MSILAMMHGTVLLMMMTSFSLTYGSCYVRHYIFFILGCTQLHF